MLKIRLLQALMCVIVTCASNFDDGSINIEEAIMEAPFSHYKYMGHFQTFKDRVWPKFEFILAFM